MNVTVVIAACGGEAWRELAYGRAYPSTIDQDAHEVIVSFDPDWTVAEARNEGAARAQGDYLCFLDADDELAPGYLEAMQNTPRTATRGPVLLAPAVQYVDSRGKPLGPPSVPNAGRWPDLNECVIGTLLPTSLFNEAGGFRELSSLEDYDLWLRCVKLGARIVHAPNAVYVAHVNPVGRNRDQSIYPRLREEHADVWG